MTSITVGTSTPKDEFWHGPDGTRFLRRETWTGDGTSKSKLTVYLGAYEEVRRSDATVKRIRASGSVVRVRVEPSSGTAAERFKYVHRDHLGSVDRVTDGTRAAASTLSSASFDPFGGRRAPDWSGDEASATSTNVLALQDERFARGFTDHEGLHRTGFVHMNGRVYDPRIGRFLQPDPVVAAPDHSQGYNRYAYVANAPLSATDPSGLMPVGGYVGRTGGTADYGALYGSIMTDLWSFVGGTGIPVVEPGWEAWEQRIRLKRMRRALDRPDLRITPEQRTYAKMSLDAQTLKKSDIEKHKVDGHLLMDLHEADNGLKLLLFGRGTEDGVIVGTGTNQLRDWDDNLRQTFGLTSAQYEAAIEVANDWAGRFVNVHFTGHSLGGGLAMAMAAKTGHYSSYTVFNAAGVHPRTVGGSHVLDKMAGTYIYSSLDVLRVGNALTRARVPGTRISLGAAGLHSMAKMCEVMRCGR